jgi:O-acetyl-ADP-ribose deacetylase (regulator of RNase III)
MPSALVGRTTTDGRKRAPQNLFGVHHRRPFPALRMFLAVGAAYYVFQQNYAIKTESAQQKFLRKVKLSPYGVLGTQLNMQGGQSRIAAEPNENTVIVDPAGLKYIHGVAAGAGGAAGSIYNWLGLRGAFPEAVRRFVTKPCDAKYHEYEGPDGTVRRVIHAVGPDFREGQWSEREAAVELSRAYRNVFHEFAQSEADHLRLLPLSGGVFAGPLYNQLPPITQQAISMAFEQLHTYDREYILKEKKVIELCIFMDREYDQYKTVFDNVTPSSKL